MDWRELWTTIIGFEPPGQYLPLALSSILLFFFVFSLCFTMHRLSETLLPQSVNIYFLDFFKTLAFCSYAFGLGMMRKYHGDIGYAMCSVPLNTLTVFLLSTGEGSPIGNWLNLVKGHQSLTKCLLRISIQMCAGLSAFRLGKLLMTLDFHQEFTEILNQTECATALKVHAFPGMIVEMVGTIWDVWFHSQHLSDNAVVDKVLKFCSSSFTFCLGGYPTGMFREPAKAFGLTYGCDGVSFGQHITVYWIGPVIGSFIAHKLNFLKLDLRHKTTKKVMPRNGKCKEYKNGSTSKKNSIRKRKYN